MWDILRRRLRPERILDIRRRQGVQGRVRERWRQALGAPQAVSHADRLGIYGCRQPSSTPLA